MFCVRFFLFGGHSSMFGNPELFSSPFRMRHKLIGSSESEGGATLCTANSLTVGFSVLGSRSVSWEESLNLPGAYKSHCWCSGNTVDSCVLSGHPTYHSTHQPSNCFLAYVSTLCCKPKKPGTTFVLFTSPQTPAQSVSHNRPCSVFAEWINGE